MDQLLSSLQEISSKLLPFFGCIALIALIMLMRSIILFLRDLKYTMKQVDGTIEKVNGTVDSVNRSIDSLQSPISTIRNISDSLDKANSFGNMVVQDSFEFLKENIGTIVEWVKSIISKFKGDTVNKEINPEDKTNE